VTEVLDRKKKIAEAYVVQKIPYNFSFLPQKKYVIILISLIVKEVVLYYELSKY